MTKTNTKILRWSIFLSIIYYVILSTYYFYTGEEIKTILSAVNIDITRWLDVFFIFGFVKFSVNNIKTLDDAINTTLLFIVCSIPGMIVGYTMIITIYILGCILEPLFTSIFRYLNATNVPE